MYILRASDGSELWKLKGNCADWHRVFVGQSLLVLDGKTGLVTAFRAASGQKLFEIAVPLQKATSAGWGESLVTFLKEETLYAAGKDKMLYALAVGEKANINNRLLWKAPVDVTRVLFVTRDRILAITRSGYLVALDRASGRVEHELKVGDEDIYTIYARGDLAIFRVKNSNRFFGMDFKKGEKTWESRMWQYSQWPVYMQGMLVFQSGKREITAINATTGETLWHHLADKSPIAIPGKNSVLVADVSGVKEYISPKLDAETSVAQAEVVTHVAQCLLQLNRPDEALAQAQRVVQELDPDCPETRLVLARIYSQRSEQENRRREMLAYLSLVDPKTPLAQLMLQNLKKDFGLMWHTDVEQADRVASDAAGKSLVLWGNQGWRSALDPESGGYLWHEKGTPYAHGGWRSPQPVFLVTRPSEESKTLQLWQVEAASGEKKMLFSVDLQVASSDISYTASKQQVLLWADESPGMGQSHHWRLFCIDAASGKLLWQTKVDSKPEEYFFGVVPGEQQVVYATGSTINVVAPETRQSVGQVTLESEVTGLAQSLANPSEFYVTYGDRHLAVLDGTSARVSRTIDLPEGEYTRPVSRDLLRGPAFYFYGPHEVVAMDLGANPRQPDRILWRFPLPEAQRVEKIKVIGDYLYCLRDDDVLLRLNAAGGKLIAENAVLWDLEDFTVNGDILYGLSSDNQAYAMKLAPLTAAAGQ
jgi:outer membrane protein assembly factor BamB